jgi:hypothetical protein
VCSETSVTFSGVDGQGRALPWALDLVGGDKQATAVQKISTNGIQYHYNNTNYKLGVPNGSGSCEQLTNGVIRITPNSSGKLAFILNDF